MSGAYSLTLCGSQGGEPVAVVGTVADAGAVDDDAAASAANVTAAAAALDTAAFLGAAIPVPSLNVGVLAREIEASDFSAEELCVAAGLATALGEGHRTNAMETTKIAS